ncbi:hypothetical protein ACKKBG_A09235 [Auxenochlorella protothecoides x Auxenochlorella symbiontica]
MTDVKSSPPLRVLVSDELGQVKVVDVAAQYATAARSATWGTVSAARAITSLASLPGDGTRPDALLVGHADGEVSCLQGLNGEAAAPLQPAASGSGEGVRSVHLVPGSGEPTVVTVSAGGCVRGFARQPDDGAWAEAWRWQAACKEVECSGVDPTGRLLAVGGRGCELRLHALADGGVAFAGRGGKPSRVGLVDRPWNTALAFLPPSPAPAGEEEPAGARLVVGTGHHRVRLYDTAAGRRPQLDVGWGEAKITALASEPSGARCWVANGQGQIAVLELPSGLVVGGIKGAAGSVKALTLHPTLPILASAGLDRTLRLHHTASRKLLAKVFLKSQLTGAAFAAAPPPQPEAPTLPLPASGGPGLPSSAALAHAVQEPASEPEEARPAAKRPKLIMPSIKKKPRKGTGPSSSASLGKKRVVVRA